MKPDKIFSTYSINESHGAWDDTIDTWNSVELFRLMNNGNLPTEKDTSIDFVLTFLHKSKNDMAWWIKNVMSRPDWGSLFLTAKRIVFRHYNSK